ncbi:aminoglycoside phosphotransferase family protein [Rickettsiales endosymbiont of Stachyamoeba lipophora]|uniref:aminoglycoside phosphotransferase family protein n=1 Tax=Rickettsiales endosymbiont of Stachyamoeba lipophora TaxID=2486578 RepID=UPI000F64907A|nr:phosphotransferase [Rickettsiales endosymbiont of Stachyamoeba lipophora]AZL15382.1 aminoglycoside phosphotransferase [Rickettsiales endosymbiont of Stachyamoeba lipophora]
MNLPLIDQRELLLIQFLVSTLHTYQHIFPFPQDASFRKYFRVTSNGKNYILMDAPPDKEPIKSFIHIAQILKANGINAPTIYEYDHENGFILLEDFGDYSFTKFLLLYPEQELELYSTAVNILIHINTNDFTNVDLDRYTWNKLLIELQVFFDYYLKFNLTESEYLEQSSLLATSFNQQFLNLPMQPSTIVHRDYHADNLQWMPHNSDFNRIGILDFQDALHGCPSYDLVSLLQDARRDLLIPEAELIDHFVTKMNFNHQDFLENYNFYGLQRNLKIIGVFNRKKYRDNNANYLKFLPRMWGYIINYVENNYKQNSLAYLLKESTWYKHEKSNY